MRRDRLRIALLALGVVLGYGSAFAELRHHRWQHAHGPTCLFE